MNSLLQVENIDRIYDVEKIDQLSYEEVKKIDSNLNQLLRNKVKIKEILRNKMISCEYEKKVNILTLTKKYGLSIPEISAIIFEQKSIKNNRVKVNNLNKYPTNEITTQTLIGFQNIKLSDDENDTIEVKTKRHPYFHRKLPNDDQVANNDDFKFLDCGEMIFQKFNIDSEVLPILGDGDLAFLEYNQIDGKDLDCSNIETDKSKKKFFLNSDHKVRKRKKKFSKEIRKEIVRDYHKNMQLKEIQKKYQISVSSIRNITQEYNFSLRKIRKNKKFAINIAKFRSSK